MTIVLALVLSGCVLGLGGLAVTGQAAAPQKRLSWQEFAKDPNRVKSFAKAVEVMRKNSAADKHSADYRRSWEYWGAMHSYYGPTSSKGTVQQASQRLQQIGLPQFVGFFQGIPDLSAPDALAKEVWDRCQHSSFKQDGTFVQAVNFFGWHRIYLFYFEQVLRFSANDQTLRLPYWDYTNEQQLAFPAEFGIGADGNPAFPSLFDFRRTQGLNEGSVVLNETLTDVDTALTNDTYLGEDGFAWAVEGGVHGNLHCAVGNTCPVPYMGAVALSANDPIFWLHHANIDRLWDCWMQIHGQPTGTWENDKFVFVDQKGTRQQRRVGDFLKSAPLGYEYDNVSACSRTPAAPLSTHLQNQPATTPTAMLNVASAKNVKLAQPVVTIDLALPTAAAERKSFTDRLAATSESRAIELVLTGITVDTAPAALFDVYVARAEDAAVRQHVGTLNFFGQGEGAHDTHGGVTRRFDVTKQLKIVLGTDTSAKSIKVIIEAASGVKAAPGKATSIKPAAQPNWKANVRINSIELRLRPVGTSPQV
jgi:hypothetical protein